MHLAPKPCNEKTQRCLEVTLANAGSKTRNDGNEFQESPRRPWRNRGRRGDEPGGGEEKLRGGNGTLGLPRRVLRAQIGELASLWPEGSTTLDGLAP